MSTNAPSSGPSSTPQPVDQVWVDRSVEALQENRPIALARRLTQLRELVTGRSLDELQSLAESIGREAVTLSQDETQVLAVRVRELLSSTELNELSENRNVDRRLEILGQRSALLNLISQHFKPGIGSRIAGGFERAYQRVISAPNAIGDFARRFGEQLERTAPNRRTAFGNQMKKGFYYALEFPSVVSRFIPVPAFLSRFAHKFRERRTRIESEERIYMMINKLQTEESIPFIEFQGFDLAAFDSFKEKHLPTSGDEVTSEEFTEAVRTAILRDITTATRQLVTNLRDPEKGGDASLGTTEDKKIMFSMAELLTPNALVEEFAETETSDLKQQVVESGAWGNGVISSVEFGTAYTFSRADGKLTIPREALNETGAPTTPKGQSLRDMVTQLPPMVQTITVVDAGDNTGLVLGKDVQFPQGRSESIDDLKTLLGFIQSNSDKISIMRNIRNQTMTGDIRYVGDELGNGILEWKSGSVINTVADLTNFFSATPSPLESASAGTEWSRGANDTWDVV